jgi:phosphonate transport system substrate-binding protein
MSKKPTDSGSDTSGGMGTRINRRRFVAGGTVLALTGLAGCSGGSGGDGSSDGSSDGSDGSSDGSDGSDSGGSSGSTDNDVEQITMLLTPGTPADARRRYKPVQNLINGEIDTVQAEMKVPQSYSAIKPALESKQAEVGMDDITLISNPDIMNVYGTTVTGGSAFYFSMMVTNPDSDVDERTDLEGGTMAFADRLSTSGSIFATYSLMQAGLGIGDAPQGQPEDFEGIWSNHDIALEKLANGEADAATTWSGNGLPHIPEERKSQLPDRVIEKDSFVETMDTEKPKFRDFWWSFAIPKQPMYARKTWDSPNNERIGEVLRNSDKDLIEQYYPDGYNEEELPFTTLADTSMEDYEPVIKRLNAVDVDLGE